MIYFSFVSIIWNIYIAKPKTKVKNITIYHMNDKIYPTT